MIRTAIEESAAPALTFADVAARVRRRPVVFALPIALGLAASLAYVFLAPKTYVAKAAIQVLPVVSDQYSSINLANVVNMATEQQIAQSSGVVHRAAVQLGTSDADIQDSVSVDSPQDTQVLDVHYAAGSAERAARGAEVVAQAYVDNRDEATNSDADKRIQGIKARITLARHTMKPPLLDAELNSLYGQQRQFETIKDIAVARIITDAAVPTAPSSPRLAVDVPLGVAAGLIAGLVLAVLLPMRERERERQRVAARGSRVTTPRRARDSRGRSSEFDEMIAAAGGRPAPASPAGSPASASRAPATAPLGVSVVPGLSAASGQKVQAPAEGVQEVPPAAPPAASPRVPAPAPAPAVSNDAPVAPAAPAPADPIPVAAAAPAPIAPAPIAPAPIVPAPAPEPAGAPAGVVPAPTPAPPLPFPFPAAPNSLFEPVRANGAERGNGAERPAAPAVHGAADGEPTDAPAETTAEIPARAASQDATPAPVPQ